MSATKGLIGDFCNLGQPFEHRTQGPVHNQCMMRAIWPHITQGFPTIQTNEKSTIETASYF